MTSYYVIVPLLDLPIAFSDSLPVFHDHALAAITTHIHTHIHTYTYMHGERQDCVNMHTQRDIYV